MQPLSGAAGEIEMRNVVIYVKTFNITKCSSNDDGMTNHRNERVGVLHWA